MKNLLEEESKEMQFDDGVRKYGKPNNKQSNHKCLLISLAVLSVIFFVVIIYLLYLLNNKNEYISFLEHFASKFFQENNELKELLMLIVNEYNNVCNQLNCLTEHNERLNSQIRDANRMIETISREPKINYHEETYTQNTNCVIF